MLIEKKLEEMGITLKDLGPCNHPILRTKQAGNLVFISGHGFNMFGKVGKELSVEEGYEAARGTTINCLSALKMHIGDLDKVKNFIKVFGMVNSAEGFSQQPDVINGCSDLLIEAFGEEIGSHARSAVGMMALPRNIAVEIEMIVEVED